jgi:hypothetical protein
MNVITCERTKYSCIVKYILKCYTVSDFDEIAFRSVSGIWSTNQSFNYNSFNLFQILDQYGNACKKKNKVRLQIKHSLEMHVAKASVVFKTMH